MHHNDLEDFVSRGLKAQAAVDEAIKGAAHRADTTKISPACSTAGASLGTASAGELANTHPRPADMLAQINTSTDTAWLKAVMGSQDYQVTIRSAAQRRLGLLFKKRKSK